MSQDNLPLVISVDDEKANLLVLERLLRKICRVVSTTKGEEALDMLQQAPVDLVLLDIMMPGMNGIEALQRIRSNSETADIPIILISAMSDTQSVTHGLEMGANDYITKPIDTDVLIARVQTQIALKQLQDQRKQTITELQAAQEMKNRFLRIASHDLKGPLMNIRMATGLLKETTGNNPGSADLLDILVSSADTMNGLIKDFLDTAAMETVALDIHFEPILLSELITDVMSENAMNANRKNIRLERGDLAGSVQADPPRFRQVIGNLVSNAVKYSPSDTTVTVWTETAGTTTSIFVADQGPGIPADEQHRLFTQFGKMSPRPTGGESSTGLGLWIVKHLVTLQNGEVGLLSPAEGGSVFWVKMPAAQMVS